MIIFADYFLEFRDFVPAPANTMLGVDIRLVGHFPYHTASIHNDSPNVNRAVYNDLEQHLRLLGVPVDNKTVFIFEEKTRFGTEDFAIFFKDCKAVVGKWEHVKGWNNNELVKKPKGPDPERAPK